MSDHRRHDEARQLTRIHPGKTRTEDFTADAAMLRGQGWVLESREERSIRPGAWVYAAAAIAGPFGMAGGAVAGFGGALLVAFGTSVLFGLGLRRRRELVATYTRSGSGAAPPTSRPETATIRRQEAGLHTPRTIRRVHEQH
ncbi:MAG: hypothetical protein KC491_14480 [Dehalococcoidia bacterium]|nr:hypothetical protein [Dehalococcoidia bacterium]